MLNPSHGARSDSQEDEQVEVGSGLKVTANRQDDPPGDGCGEVGCSPDSVRVSPRCPPTPMNAPARRPGRVNLRCIVADDDAVFYPSQRVSLS